MKRNYIVMGGTFDRLHKGHESDLKTAFGSGEKVTIGLTTVALLKNKKLMKTIQSYDERKQQLESYTKKNWPDVPVDIIAIDDPYGPAVDDHSMEVLVVTKETRKNGETINDMRLKEGLGELVILEAPWILADDGEAVSSTRIRMGEIDREGFVYSSMFSKILRLPNSLRAEFKKPPGEVVRGGEDDVGAAAHKAKKSVEDMDPTVVITVGDIVTSSLIESGLTPHVSIIDHKTQRKNLAPSGAKIEYDGTNLPGTINHEIVPHIARAVARALNDQKTTQIVIDGEEDLLVPPSILLSPLNAVVLHGQAGEGIVITQVTEEKKSYIRRLIEQFDA